tara:strand:- start:10474 stop:13293 length:2820 start_codon:yes stop_codon:yes gene_type:complete
MATLKMFFCIASENLATDITIHRELNSIYTLWNREKSDDKIGIIHIGFIRPKVPSYGEIEHFHGTLLVSASAKWSLPEEYNTSNKAISKNNRFPLFQLLTGFGYNLEAANNEFLYSEDPSIDPTGSLNNNHTIASVAFEILESLAKPMSKEEIYGHIIERNLFQFGAKKPISVLNVELNRHCEGTDYSQAASKKLFGKSKSGQFFALGTLQKGFNSWLTGLSESVPELAKICVNYNIFDENSYFENKQFLSESQIRELELIRYQELKKEINVKDPSELIAILPISILEAHITQLGLTVRASNVLNVQNIFKLKDAIGYSLQDMMKWDNFGKKSAKDLCEVLDASVKKLSFILPINYDFCSSYDIEIDEEIQVMEIAKTSTFEHISQIPLKEHFENSLSLLKENERTVLENRAGYRGSVKTLEEVGEMIGVTRERVRQIQKKNISKIISTEFWDDCIAIKIGGMLLNREQPLYLEMLEVEDVWFKGFIGNYQHLAAIIELFSENEIRVIKIDSAMVISRIQQDDWDTMISNYRKSLRHKANEKTWSKYDVELTFKASLEEKGASELYPLLWGAFADVLIFDESSSGRELLISYGKTLNSAILAVLHQAESPLHFSVIAERVREHLGKDVTNPQVNSGLHKVGAKLFDRGIYGLPHFNPISEGTCQHLRVVIETLVLNGPLMKQWHTTEFLNILWQKFPTLPDELNQYILNLILESSEQLTYLNKNVWARYDSNQSPEDRVDMADAFCKILEDAGTPLKGKELIKRLEDIRGVNDKLQLQATDRMIQVGPDTWGLYERDISLTAAEIRTCLDNLYLHLTKTQSGIHHSEVKIFLIENSLSHLNVSGYELLNLAQRDNRFYLGRSLFLGLAEWGEDTRRLNVAQAVRKVVSEMQSPMSTIEINVLVEKLTGLEIDGTLTGIIPKEGGKYNPETRLWGKVLSQ